MNGKEILNDPIFLEIKNGNIGNVDNSGLVIDTKFAIKMLWIRDNLGFDTHICYSKDGYLFYILDQDLDWKSVYKSSGFTEHDDCYRAAIAKIVELSEMKLTR